jgi:hypothetical protein
MLKKARQAKPAGPSQEAPNEGADSGKSNRYRVVTVRRRWFNYGRLYGNGAAHQSFPTVFLKDTPRPLSERWTVGRSFGLSRIGAGNLLGLYPVTRETEQFFGVYSVWVSPIEAFLRARQQAVTNGELDGRTSHAGDFRGVS